MTDNVVITRTGSVLEIRLDRPEKKNALTRAMYNAMADAFDQVDTDPTLRVALLTGTGDTFTSGNDISVEIHTPQGEDAPDDVFAQSRDPLGGPPEFGDEIIGQGFAQKVEVPVSGVVLEIEDGQ